MHPGKTTKLFIIQALLISMTTLIAETATGHAWADQTHMAVERAAGFPGYHNASAADAARTLQKLYNHKDSDGPGHYYDSTAHLTRTDVERQLKLVGKNNSSTKDGWILGAIIHTVRQTKTQTTSGKYSEYYYALLGHYCGDLSMPLHMSVYDDFNKKHHLNIDCILERNDVTYDIDGVPLITKEMTVDDSVRFTTEDEIIDYMLQIANASYELSRTIRKENRELTHDEAIACINRSATFFRALLRYCGKAAVDDEFVNYTK